MNDTRVIPPQAVESNWQFFAANHRERDRGNALNN
jgi:hypothetical protein